MPYHSCKFWRFSLTRIDSEFLLLFHGKNNVRMYRANLARYMNRKVYAGALALVTVIVLAFAFTVSGRGTATADDEARKNELLLSDETNYSSPKEEKALNVSVYRVQNGDTLSTIARKFGVSLDTICGSNNLDSYDCISVGTVLYIPNKDGILHTIGRGQNMISVAQKYRTDINKIIAANTTVNPDLVQEGVQIFVPDAKPVNIIDGWLWPTATRSISSAFGWRRNPFTGAPDFHNGIDIIARYEYVRSSKYGKVTFAGWLGGYGYAVIIAHPGGWKSLYGHLSSITVRSGQYVKQGQVVAVSGNTGYSTGPHLHFELIRNGQHVNPYAFLKR
jgi:murein DD-endopeptidase MepM/ murein hydrolase activator NlpD